MRKRGVRERGCEGGESEERGQKRGGYLVSLSVKTYSVISRLLATTQSTVSGVSPRAVT